MGLLDKIKNACGVKRYEQYLKEHKKTNPNEKPLDKDEYYKKEKEKLGFECSA